MVLRKITVYYNCTNPNEIDQVCMLTFLMPIKLLLSTIQMGQLG